MIHCHAAPIFETFCTSILFSFFSSLAVWRDDTHYPPQENDKRQLPVKRAAVMKVRQSGGANNTVEPKTSEALHCFTEPEITYEKKEKFWNVLRSPLTSSQMSRRFVMSRRWLVHSLAAALGANFKAVSHYFECDIKGINVLTQEPAVWEVARSHRYAEGNPVMGIYDWQVMGWGGISEGSEAADIIPLPKLYFMHWGKQALAHLGGQ
jgi:hypothetical protein